MRFLVEQEGITVKQILVERQHVSHRLLVRLKQNQGILCNGQPVWVSHRCHAGDWIELHFPKELSSNLPLEEIPLEILYEDEAMLVINKPPGMPPHPSYLHAQGTAAGAVAGYYARHGIQTQVRALGRLDRNTSGIMVFGKNPWVQENMVRQQQNGSVCKTYLAVVQGRFAQQKGMIEAPIGRKTGSLIERCVCPEGKLAKTGYEVLCQGTRFSLLLLCPITGRTHQLRVHMAYLGHPLAGDTLYGGTAEGLERHALHAYQVSLYHPVTGKRIEFQAPLPQDIQDFIDKEGLVW